MICGWRPLLHKILGQYDSVLQKMAISNRYSLVAHQGAQKHKMAIFRRTWIEESLLQNFFMLKLSAARLKGIHYSLSKRAKMVG